MRCTLVVVVYVIKFNVVGDFARCSCFCTVAPRCFNKLEVVHGCLILLYVIQYCLTVIADVIATYFIFFLFLGLVMNMCVQER